MPRLFARIRWRLVGWTMLIVGLILLLLEATVFFTTQQRLMSEVDQTLARQSDQVLPPPPPRSGGGGDRGDRGFRGPEGFRGGIFFMGLDASGALIANPQQVSDDVVAQLPPANDSGPVFATLLANGEPTRVVARRMSDGGTLIVGQSLTSELSALQLLLVILLGGAGLGLLLSFAGAWFLAGRALVPIQQAFQRQQEFVADASHELRTPLTVLQASTDMLNQLRDEPLEANADLLDDIRNEIARMVRLTSDLLTLARTDRGELELMVAPLELPDLATDVVRRASPLAEQKRVSLAVVADEPVGVEADPDRLQQVLLILLDNAIKHTPSGGKVEVRVHQQGQHAILEVADTGEGIAPEHLARIFDRFYRADSARSRDRGGTGLGLAIARLLVEAHGGEIEASSILGHGTCMTVRLPAAGRPPLGGRLGELAAQLVHPSGRQ